MVFHEMRHFLQLFSEKFIKTLNQNLELFEQSILFRGFEELFGKKLQKVAHFVKNHEKSSIWLKLATFRINYHVLRFR